MKQFFKYSFIALLLLACFCSRSQAQNVHVDARLDRVSIPIGDQATLKLSITFPAKDSVSFPVLKDSIGKLQIVKMGKPDTSFASNDVNTETISKCITLTCFDSGAYLIPDYTFTTKSGTFKTQPLQLQITAVKVDTTKAIFDIKQPLAVKYTLWDWLKDNWKLVAIIAVILLAIAGVVIYFITRPKKVKVVEEVKTVIVPDYQIAMDKLNALRDKKLWQAGFIKEYHSELTDIMREYLEKRFLIKAHEQTTDEIFSSLKHLDMSRESAMMLRQILTLADLAKFAKEQPLPAENEQSMEQAIKIITQTREDERLFILQGRGSN